MPRVSRRAASRLTQSCKLQEVLASQMYLIATKVSLTGCSRHGGQEDAQVVALPLRRAGRVHAADNVIGPPLAPLPTCSARMGEVQWEVMVQNATCGWIAGIALVEGCQGGLAQLISDPLEVSSVIKNAPLHSSLCVCADLVGITWTSQFAEQHGSNSIG